MDFTPLNEYIAFLWTQFQYDWNVFTRPWVLYTVIPAILYLVFFWIKWCVLLFPITVPLSLFIKNKNDNVEENLLKLQQHSMDK